MSKKQKQQTRIEWDRALLNSERRETIKRFLERANAGNAQHPFDAFIDVWIAFNAIGSNVTWFASDRKIIEALKVDSRCKDTFQHLIGSDNQFVGSVNRFRAMWPVFSETKAYDAYRIANGFPPNLTPSEAQVMEFCRNGGIEGVPLNNELAWPNVLAALYQVRCNLFHGGKNPINRRDRELAALGKVILARFINALDLL